MNSQEIEQSLVLAEHYFRNNNYKLAEQILKKITHLDKLNPKANELLAYIYGNQGQTSLSFDLLSIASKHPDCSPEALYYLGSSLLQRQDFVSAAKTLELSLKKAGDFFEGLHDLATAHAQLNQKQDALFFYKKALAYRKDSHELFFNMGRLFDDLQLTEEALLHYELALKIKPDFHLALLNKCIALDRLGRYSGAIESYDKLIALFPLYAEAYCNKGATLSNLNQHLEAIDCHNKALTLVPDYQEALCNKAICLNALGKHKEAIYTINYALSVKPNDPKALSCKGVILKNQHAYNKALAYFQRAVDLDPNFLEAKNNRALLNLSLKNFTEGWKDYSARSGANNQSLIRIKPQFTWDGISRCEHLLIINEQGIGDEIFYTSLLSLIRDKVRKISMMTDKRLIPIFSRSFPNISFFDKKFVTNNLNYDFYILAGDIPGKINLDLDLIKKRIGSFLISNESKTNTIKNTYLTNKKMKCGISWKSSNKSHGNEKSTSLPNLKKIFELKELDFINLQYGNIEEEINQAKNELGVDILQIKEIDLFEDIDGLLSMIDACDIVVTTSNVTAHLAGAIGKKTLLLVPYAQGRIWYWHDDEVSIWYPSIKQYFQDVDLSWDNAINKIALELEQEIARKN